MELWTASRLRLSAGRSGLEEALKVGAQVAEGLAAAHKQGIVHRDSAGNIVLTKTGAKILTPGVAKLRGDAVVEMATRTVTPLTSAGGIVGTVQYMAPEQLEAKPIDHRADLFAFGAVLYDAHGQRAFSGTSQASIIALLTHAAVVGNRPTITPVDRVVKSCLAKDPTSGGKTVGILRVAPSLRNGRQSPAHRKPAVSPAPWHPAAGAIASRRFLARFVAVVAGAKLATRLQLVAPRVRFAGLRSAHRITATLLRRHWRARKNLPRRPHACLFAASIRRGGVAVGPAARHARAATHWLAPKTGTLRSGRRTAATWLFWER